MSKTASGLVEYCKAQLGLPYWMGTFGNTASAALYAANKARLPKYYTASDFPSQYGKRVHDCVGLVKGYRWSDTPTSVPVYNAAQDVAVGGLYNQCSKRGGIATMPEQAGVCVFMAGMTHVGVYIGDGYVIEARGHAYGVVKTKLTERGWKYWGKPDWLDYDTEETRSDPAVKVSAKQLSEGSQGSAVRKLQVLLAYEGQYTAKIDGDFGAKTTAAVKAFQKANGLKADGIAGPATLAKLFG